MPIPRAPPCAAVSAEARRCRSASATEGWQTHRPITTYQRVGSSGRCASSLTIGAYTMSIFALLLNLLWLFCGGLWMAAGWLVASIVMAITIIGIPWARAAFNIAAYTLLPFGQTAVSRADYLGREDIGTGPLGLLGNIIWFVLAGWWLALLHLVHAILLAVTIIGIPFAWAHLKLAGLALWPIGKTIVPIEAATRRFVR